MTLNADWHNHHIEGNLYVGGCIDGVRIEDDFRHVVSLYTWERYALGPDTRLHEYEMYDATEMPDETSALLRWKRSPVVLCNQAVESWLLVLAVT